MTSSISQLTDHLLVATPNLEDTDFSQSVIYICEHSADSVTGVMVNKPMDMDMQHVFQKMGITPSETGNEHAANQDVFSGGPVSTSHGLILYHETSGDRAVHVSSSPELLNQIAQGEGPEHYLMSLGYAGWDNKQLEEEILNHDWLVVPVSKQCGLKILFDTPAQDRWLAAARLLGYDLHTINHQVGHA